MDFGFSEAQEEWRQEVRDFIRENALPEQRMGGFDFERGHLPIMKQWTETMRKQGWTGAGWPKEIGGMGMHAVDQWIMQNELLAAGLITAGDSMVGPTLMRVASEEMKQEYIPKLRTGEVRFALGYSEPNAGTDLASLETKAELDGDEIVINGTKIWNSGGHTATHEWLTVRTDPKVPKHKGISVVIVPIDSPGISIRPIWTWGDVRTNQVFFENVRVPRKNLVGEINKGWGYIGAALDFERVHIGLMTDLQMLFNQIVDYVKETRRGGQLLSKDPIVRNQLAKLWVELMIARGFSLRCAWMVGSGNIPFAEASMAKIWTTELRVKLGDIGMQIMGLYGQLRKESKYVPVNGDAEHLLRISPMSCFAGGTNEIQRDLIARKGLGLPRGGAA